MGALADCLVCNSSMYWIDCPTGGWWKHVDHPDDDHDAASDTPSDIHNGGIRHAEGEVHQGLFESYCECGWISGLTPDPLAAALVLTDHQIADWSDDD